jgi:hypothetical protein
VGLKKKKKKKKKTNPSFGKYCVPLPSYNQSAYGAALRMILATTECVFAFEVISLHFE